MICCRNVWNDTSLSFDLFRKASVVSQALLPGVLTFWLLLFLFACPLEHQDNRFGCRNVSMDESWMNHLLSGSKHLFIYLQIPWHKMDNWDQFKSFSLLYQSVLQPKHVLTTLTQFYRRVAKGSPQPCSCANKRDKQIPPTHAIKSSSVSCPRTLPHSAKVIDPSTNCLINGAPALCFVPHSSASFILMCLLYAVIPIPICAQKVATCMTNSYFLYQNVQVWVWVTIFNFTQHFALP